MDDNENQPLPSSKVLEYMFKRLLELETRIEQLEEKKSAAPKSENDLLKELIARSDALDKKLDILIGHTMNIPETTVIEDIGGQAVQNDAQPKPKAKNTVSPKSVAVFIDGENISHKKAKKVIEQAKSFGTIEFSRVYGVQNNNSDKCWIKTATELNIKHIRLAGGSKKNKVDKKMIEEINNEAKKKNHADTIVIATNDGDFSATVKEINDKGVYITVVGLKTAMSDKLKKACNSFVYL